MRTEKEEEGRPRRRRKGERKKTRINKRWGCIISIKNKDYLFSFKLLRRGRKEG